MIENLIKALNTDEGYRLSWKANIAMAFCDEYNRRTPPTLGFSTDDIHDIANTAADNFLNILTMPRDKSSTCPSTHGHVLTLFGQRWDVIRTTLPGSAFAELNEDTHTIVIDRHDDGFMPTLIHELTEFVLEELGCHYGNFDGDHKYIMSHTQMDNVVQIVWGAMLTLTAREV